MKYLITVTIFLLLFTVSAQAKLVPTPLADVAVATAGTEQVLSATNLLTPSLCVQAKSGNSGQIFVGDSTVSSTQGVELDAGQSICFKSEKGVFGYDLMDVKDVYVDTDSNGDGVKLLYYKQVN